MRLVRPITMTDAQLTSSNVGETVAAYSAGTVYGLGDQVSVASGTTLTIYESLISGNLARAPGSYPDWWRQVSTAYSAYSAGTTYALGARVQVIGADSHLVYESLQAGNLNHAPATSPTWWVEVGPTNAWAMFDQSNSSQTTRAESITVTIDAADRVDAVALMNISALSARLVITDAVDGVVYDQTVSLTSDSGITDYDEWFFEPVVRKSDYAFVDLPPYYQPTVTLTLEDAGNTVAIGACVLGLARTIGGTQYGASIGIQDYSVKTVDDFGVATVTQRAYAKRGTFALQVDADYVDEVARLLASYRATPVVWIGSDDYGASILYGFYKDFSLTIAYPTISICNLEIEGLT